MSNRQFLAIVAGALLMIIGGVGVQQGWWGAETQDALTDLGSDTAEHASEVTGE